MPCPAIGIGSKQMTVVQLVKAFGLDWNETVDLQCTDQPSIPQDQIDILSNLLSKDRQWVLRELSLEVGLSHQKVWYIIKKCQNVEEIAVRWVPHQLTEVQKWRGYALAGIHLEKY
ncbi:uncharacterized protein TNCV_724531 [Trichonephila clavipes]|nr:uncharacterized protein TNCV_724531 [Trichonephila clavipes]